MYRNTSDSNMIKHLNNTVMKNSKVTYFGFYCYMNKFYFQLLSLLWTSSNVLLNFQMLPHVYQSLPRRGSPATFIYY